MVRSIQKIPKVKVKKLMMICKIRHNLLKQTVNKLIQKQINLQKKKTYKIKMSDIYNNKKEILQDSD